MEAAPSSSAISHRRLGGSPDQLESCVFSCKWADVHRGKVYLIDLDTHTYQRDRLLSRLPSNSNPRVTTPARKRFSMNSKSSQVRSYSPGEHEGSAQREPQGPALEIKLELIQSQVAQKPKPKLRGEVCEVGAQALDFVPHGIDCISPSSLMGVDLT